MVVKICPLFSRGNRGIKKKTRKEISSSSSSSSGTILLLKTLRNIYSANRLTFQFLLLQLHRCFLARVPPLIPSRNARTIDSTLQSIPGSRCKLRRNNVLGRSSPQPVFCTDTTEKKNRSRNTFARIDSPQQLRSHLPRSNLSINRLSSTRRIKKNSFPLISEFKKRKEINLID